jgi:predicted neuraminidase
LLAGLDATSQLWRGMIALLLAAMFGSDAVVKSEFIFETAPFPQCHASTIAETKSGLVAAWFGGTKERSPDVGIWLSRSEAGKWTAAVEVAKEPGLPAWNPVLFRPKAGPLWLFYKIGPSPSAWWGMQMSSTDDGRTWSKPQRIAAPCLGPIKNKPVQLANGDILSPSSTEDNGWRVHFERSTDGGKTWQFIAVPTNEFSAIQPAILVHPGHRLQAIGRTKQQRLFSIESADGGKTWGEMSLLPVPNPNSGVDAVTLADGRHLLVYNRGERTEQSRGRDALHVALSADGRQWRDVGVLEREPGAEFSYPAVIQTGDGLVHITYTWKRQRIRHVVLDPAKLK